MRKVPNPKPAKLISLVHQGHLESQIQILTFARKKKLFLKKTWVSTLNCCFDANDRDKLVALNFWKRFYDFYDFYDLWHAFQELPAWPPIFSSTTEPPYHEPTRIMAPCRCAATPMSRVASLCWLKVWKATDKKMLAKMGILHPWKH